MLPEVSFVETDMEQEGSGLFAGKYLGSRTAVELGIESRTQSLDVRQSVNPFLPPILPTDVISPVSPGVILGVAFPDSDTTTEDVRLSFRHIGETGGLTWSVRASIRSSRFADEHSSAAAEFQQIPGRLRAAARDHHRDPAFARRNSPNGE